MTTNFIKLFCSTLAFGAGSAALGLAVAMIGLFLIGEIGGNSNTTPRAAIAHSGSSR